MANIQFHAATGYEDGVADGNPRPEATSYLVVLQDNAGNARTFTIDMTSCGEMYGATDAPPVETYLGLASTSSSGQCRTASRDTQATT